MVLKFKVSTIEIHSNNVTRVSLESEKIAELLNKEQVSGYMSISFPTSKLDFSLGEYEVTFKKIK